MTENASDTNGVLTDDWIERHNKEVRAFRAKHFPRIKALTDDECRRIYERWTTPGINMTANLIALEFRDELGMTWEKSHAVGIGMEMIREVLVRLDEYDPDFRPRPEPQLISQVGDSSLYYLPATHMFRVEVGNKAEEFRATHAPRFGVDVADLAMAEEVAARLEKSADSSLEPL